MALVSLPGSVALVVCRIQHVARAGESPFKGCAAQLLASIFHSFKAGIDGKYSDF